MIRPQTGVQGCFQVTALRADARYKEPQVWRGSPDMLKRFGLGGANDEADIIPGVPFLGEAGDVNV